MSFFILGTGHALPKLEVSNADLTKLVDTSDEWIVSKTGIQSRRILSDESMTDLSKKAAELAIENANISKEEIDMVIYSSICADTHTPSGACAVSKMLGINAPAFDINAACSGFLYSLDVADGFFARKKVKKVLLICAEQMSRHIDWNDRATCVLFGDGASAVVLGEGDGLLSIKLSAVPNIDLMHIPFVGGDSPFDKKEKQKPYLYMNGQEIYKFAVSSSQSDIKSVLSDAGIKQSDVDFVILHQANMRIINAAKEKLEIDHDKYLNCIQHTGNISSATIPIVLDEANRSGILKKGSILVMSAFGGGLTSAAAVIKWNKD